MVDINIREERKKATRKVTTTQHQKMMNSVKVLALNTNFNKFLPISQKGREM